MGKMLRTKPKLSERDWARNILSVPGKWIAKDVSEKFDEYTGEYEITGRYVTRWQDSDEFECADDSKHIMFKVGEIEQALDFYLDGIIPQGTEVEHINFVYG